MSFDRDKVLAALRAAPADGIKMADLAARLRVGGKHQHQLRKLVAAMVADGTVAKAGRYNYVASAPAPGGGNGQRVQRAEPMAIGRIRVHPAGYGFVQREDEEADVFVPAKYRGTAIDGDRVELYTWDGYKGTEGRVERVLSRGRAKLTGTLQRAGRGVFLEPDDPRIASTYGRVHVVDSPHARVGDCVLVEITRYPTAERQEIAGRVLRTLGPPDDPRTEVAKIVACADIPEEFPDAAIAQADATPQELVAGDFADRIDLRDRPFLTIDPETARDFDDAICLEGGPHGYRAWVAVADVSHYVRPDDALDREAQLRGVSVYFPDRSIPMLPPALSSGICSLNPEVDRCAMVVRLDIDGDGVVRDRGYAAAVIRSHARLEYAGVAGALAGDFRGRRASYRRWARTLEEMDALARVMRARRMKRGALQLELPEAKVVLDEDDPLLVSDVVRAKGVEGVRRAYELVEEFMLAANEAVGEFFSERGLHTVWRNHAAPDEDRVAELAEVLRGFGVKVDPERATEIGGLQGVLDQLAGKPAERALMFLVLRSLPQAVYGVDNIGHFGLASERYLHFTSPIRRYPDLLVHRLLKYYLHQEGQASGGARKWSPPEAARLAELAADSSAYERRAAEAEREVVDMYRAYLMRGRVGEQFWGAISAVTSFGVFVELDEPFVEGLIKLDSLGDERFEFDTAHMRIRGKRTGRTFSLGDRLLVDVVNVSVQRRQIDLRIEQAAEPEREERPRGRRDKRDERGRGGKGANGGRRRRR